MNWFLRMFGGKPKAVAPKVVAGTGPKVTATVEYKIDDNKTGSTHTNCHAQISYSDGHTEAVHEYITTEYGVEHIARKMVEEVEKRVRYYQDLKRNGTWTQEVK